MTDQASQTWTATRHGGRHVDTERTLFSGDEATARRGYDREAARLRQGVVRLIRPDGSEVAVKMAYRNRTRWQPVE
jgi:hypothetical protein